MSTGAGPLFGSNQFALPTGGSNQWMSYPSMPGQGGGSSGMSNSMTQQVGSTNPFAGPASSQGVANNTTGNSNYVGQGYYEAPTYDPSMTSNFFQMLQGLMSGGGGELQSQLLSFLNGGQTNIPGAQSLTQMANTGDPISALPEWQAMIDAQQRNIGENAANLKEQFAFAGDLQSSPMATGMSDFFTQTSKDQNALLGQLDTAAMENAMQRELTASQSLTGMAANETQFLDSLFSSGALASPNLFKKSSSSILGGIGSILGDIPGIGNMIKNLTSSGSSGSGAGNIQGLLAALGI